MALFLVTETLGEQGWEGVGLRRQICLSLSKGLHKVFRFESCIRLPGGLVKPRLLPHPEVQIRWVRHGARTAPEG